MKQRLPTVPEATLAHFMDFPIIILILTLITQKCELNFVLLKILFLI